MAIYVEIQTQEVKKSLQFCKLELQWGRGWTIFQVIQKFTGLSLNLQSLALWQSHPQIKGQDKYIWEIQVFFYQLCSQQNDRKKNFP